MRRGGPSGSKQRQSKVHIQKAPIVFIHAISTSKWKDELRKVEYALSGPDNSCRITSCRRIVSPNWEDSFTEAFLFLLIANF